jgi:hypothetical protein
MAIDRAAGGRYPTLFDIGELELLESEAEQEGETGEVFNEADVAELASRLLDVSNEAEFDRLLGGMISHASQQVGGELRAPLGKALGGLLKSLAKQALPPTRTALGGGASPQAHMLGMELEGLDEVEAEFQCTKQFVRLAGETVRNALESEPLGIPASLKDTRTHVAVVGWRRAMPVRQTPGARPIRVATRRGRAEPGATLDAARGDRLADATPNLAAGTGWLSFSEERPNSARLLARQLEFQPGDLGLGG